MLWQDSPTELEINKWRSKLKGDSLMTKNDIINSQNGEPALINIHPKYFDEAVKRKDLPQPITRVSGRMRLWKKSDIEHFIKTGEVQQK